MRIVQMLPTFAYGDAIGNHVLALHHALCKANYQSMIVADSIRRGVPRKVATPWAKYSPRPDDVVLYHLSTGAQMNTAFGELVCGKKVVVYHNVTPPQFFRGYDPESEKVCRRGLAAARELASKVDYAFAVSGFNRRDLQALGYRCPISVLPILVRFSDYDAAPDAGVLARYADDGVTNIVFTGRIVPNKKFEDVIKSFYYYKRDYNQKSRLILVGRYEKDDLYYKKLRVYANELELEDAVVFTGHISFAQILAYYHLADALLCLSQHEGFCVPLVEAMYFSVPVVAYDCCAVGETLGGAGVLSPTNDPQIVAGLLNKLLTDPDVKERALKNADERLKDFAHDKIEAQFLAELGKIVEGIDR